MLKQIAIYSRYFLYARYRKVVTVLVQIISSLTLMLAINYEGSLMFYIQFVTYLSALAAFFGVIDFLTIRQERYLMQYHTIVKSPLVPLFSKVNVELLILFQIQILYFIFMQVINPSHSISLNNWLLVFIASIIIVLVFTFAFSILITLELDFTKIDSLRTLGSIFIFLISFSGESLPPLLIKLNPINQINNFVFLLASEFQFTINIYLILALIICLVTFVYSIHNIKIYVRE